MQEYDAILRKCPLFEGIEAQDMDAMLACLGGKVLKVRKNQIILAEGEKAEFVGIVLEGSVQIVKEDYFGNRSIVTQVDAGELFGESFACANVAALPVSVVAARDSSVMLIDCHRITVSCSNACSFHSRMIFNLLKVVATKNLMFNQKIEVTSKRTTRQKLMTYLLQQAKRAGNNAFTIPYDRQALADYLEVERSAMSAEIGKLRKEGVLESEKNYFRLLQAPDGAV